MMARFRWLLAALLVLLLGAAAVVFMRSTRPRSFRMVTIPAEGYSLAGYLSEGEDPSQTWVIFVHGNRAGGQDELLYRRLVGNLRPDVSVLAIDMRGFGRSPDEGLESSDRVLDRTGDIEAAAAYLEENYGVGKGKIVLMGHSLGSLQVLKEGQSEAYREVISIGPGDFRAFISDRASLQNYAAKLQASMGVPVSPGTIEREGVGFTPEALFKPCPLSPTVLVFGQFDLRESLREVPDEIPAACFDALRWITIPLSDHMYWTEFFFLPEPIRSLVSWLPVSLLLRQINAVLAEGMSARVQPAAQSDRSGRADSRPAGNFHPSLVGWHRGLHRVSERMPMG